MLWTCLEPTTFDSPFLPHASGFYLGTWGSNVSWLSDAVPDASSSMEWDFYGGYKGSLPNDFGYDLGLASVVSPLRLRGLAGMLARIKAAIARAG